MLWPAMRKSSEEGREMECNGGERFEACVRMPWFSSGFPLFHCAATKEEVMKMR